MIEESSLLPSVYGYVPGATYRIGYTINDSAMRGRKVRYRGDYRWMGTYRMAVVVLLRVGTYGAVEEDEYLVQPHFIVKV